LYTEQIKEHTASVLDRAANAAKQAGVPCDTIHVQMLLLEFRLDHRDALLAIGLSAMAAVALIITAAAAGKRTERIREHRCKLAYDLRQTESLISMRRNSRLFPECSARSWPQPAARAMHHAQRGRAGRNLMREREGSDGPQQDPTVAYNQNEWAWGTAFISSTPKRRAR
jgi:hypothetical protein